MKRSVLTIAAGLIFTFGMAGCGGGDPEIPDGHTADEIRTEGEGAPAEMPGRDIEGPQKNSGGG